jgi:hypothetical protein
MASDWCLTFRQKSKGGPNIGNPVGSPLSMGGPSTQCCHCLYSGGILLRAHLTSYLLLCLLPHGICVPCQTKSLSGLSQGKETCPTLSPATTEVKTKMPVTTISMATTNTEATPLSKALHPPVKPLNLTPPESSKTTCPLQLLHS